MNLRIEKAKTLLKNGGIQVSEVAAKVGYGDPLAFSKVFKARTGRSPREYKEEKRKLVVKGKKGIIRNLRTDSVIYFTKKKLSVCARIYKILVSGREFLCHKKCYRKLLPGISCNKTTIINIKVHILNKFLVV